MHYLSRRNTQPVLNTPWGIADYVKELADGILSIGTPSHGGLKLSADRWKQLKKALPYFSPYNGNTYWLEEDCDWAAAAIVWPELFSEENQRIAQAIATRYEWRV